MGNMRELKTPILIIGGGTGGSAAALACARMGIGCIVTEPTDWIGGQLTSQAVPPDENRWIETFGGNRSYQDLRNGVRRYYRQVRGGLSVKAATDPHLNPGGGWVSRLCAEPRIWHDVLSGMLLAAGFTFVSGALAPRDGAGGRERVSGADGASGYQSGAARAVMLNLQPMAAELVGDTIRTFRFIHTITGEEIVIEADLVLDATETGDVLALANIEHAIGAEHRDVYGELHGRADFDIKDKASDWIDQQACSWCFAIEHRPGENHTIDKPKNYDWWRVHVPDMSPPWCGPLFSWTVPSHTAMGCRTFRMVPWPSEPAPGELEMWRYRRIVDSAVHSRNGLERDATDHPDVSLINMVQMDHWRRPLLGVGGAEAAAALAGAREQSLCFLYWMQTEASRHDGKGVGYPGLKLRGDELGTTDGFAKSPYIREPRRLLARTMVTEAHIGTDQRRAAGIERSDPNWLRVPDGLGTAEAFADSVGIGHYMIDLHPSCAGRNNVYVPAAPFRIPMGALIPVRVKNVLAAGKCLGVTHITNGAYRMHHVEWSVGEAAGVLAAWCVCEGRAAVMIEPTAVHGSAEKLQDVRRVLGEQGVRMAWPWEI